MISLSPFSNDPVPNWYEPHIRSGIKRAVGYSVIVKKFCKRHREEIAMQFLLMERFIKHEQPLFHAKLFDIRLRNKLSLNDLAKPCDLDGSNLNRSLLRGTLTPISYVETIDYLNAQYDEEIQLHDDTTILCAKYLALGMAEVRYEQDKLEARRNSLNPQTHMDRLVPKAPELAIEESLILCGTTRLLDPEFFTTWKTIVRERSPYSQIIHNPNYCEAFQRFRENVGKALSNDPVARDNFQFWETQPVEEFIHLVIKVWNSWGEYYFFVDELLYELMRQPLRLRELYKELYYSQFSTGQS